MPLFGSSGGAKCPVYLVDVGCYKPPEEWRTSKVFVDHLWRSTQRYPEEDLDFCERIAKRSGIDPYGTYLPPAINPRWCGNDQKSDMNNAMLECRQVVCGAVENILNKTGLVPFDIDILVTTCSIFCPTPSMSAMVVNAFGMRPDIQSYHLGGMGCSNGVVAVNLIADLLAAHPNCNALLVTTETTTPAYYAGNERSRLVTNLLFRAGASAILFTNKPSMRKRAKYVLDHHLRVHAGGADTTKKPITASSSSSSSREPVKARAMRPIGVHGAIPGSGPPLPVAATAAPAGAAAPAGSAGSAAGSGSVPEGFGEACTAGDAAYYAIQYCLDDKGLTGIYLGMNVVTEATRALTMLLWQVGPYVLTWKQCGEFAANAAARTVLRAVHRALGSSSAPRASAAAALPSSGKSPSPSSSSPAPAGKDQDKQDKQQDTPQQNGDKTVAQQLVHRVNGTNGTAAAAANADVGSRATKDGMKVVLESVSRSSSSRSPSLLKMLASVLPPVPAPYKPAFGEAVPYFLIHAGGAKVLDGIGAALCLSNEQLAPSRAVLWDYGNVSSSSTWYTLANLETTRGVHKGEKIMQIGVGSGIKCGVNVWRALRDVRDLHEAWAHRVPEHERRAIEAVSRADRLQTSFAWQHAIGRLLLALLMVVVLVYVHLMVENKQ